jgi:hypothetical protein
MNPSKVDAVTNEDMEHYLTHRVIPDLQDAGFDSALETAEEDYVTLTITRARRQHYY